MVIVRKGDKEIVEISKERKHCMVDIRILGFVFL